MESLRTSTSWRRRCHRNTGKLYYYCFIGTLHFLGRMSFTAQKSLRFPYYISSFFLHHACQSVRCRARGRLFYLRERWVSAFATCKSRKGLHFLACLSRSSHGTLPPNFRSHSANREVTCALLELHGKRFCAFCQRHLRPGSLLLSSLAQESIQWLQHRLGCLAFRWRPADDSERICAGELAKSVRCHCHGNAADHMA